MRIGYARTAPGETTLARQRDALIAAGCGIIFEDEDIKASVVLKPGLASALRAARTGDTIVVWRLDRLAWSLGTLLTDLHLLESLGLGFEALEDGIDSSKEDGLYAHVSALARFSDMVATARRAQHTASGRKGARGPGRDAAIDGARWRELVALMKPPASIPVAQIAKLAGVSRQAIYKRLKAEANSTPERERVVRS